TSHLVGRRAQLRPAGASVPRVTRFAVPPAQSPGGEHADTGPARQQRRGGDRGRAVTAARRGWPEIAHAELGNLGTRGDTLHLVGGQTDGRLAANHTHRRRYAALGIDDRLELTRQRQVLGLWHTVRDQRAFEGDHWPAPGERLGDLGP